MYICMCECQWCSRVRGMVHHGSPPQENECQNQGRNWGNIGVSVYVRNLGSSLKGGKGELPVGGADGMRSPRAIPEINTADSPILFMAMQKSYWTLWGLLSGTLWIPAWCFGGLQGRERSWHKEKMGKSRGAGDGEEILGAIEWNWCFCMLQCFCIIYMLC